MLQTELQEAASEDNFSTIYPQYLDRKGQEYKKENPTWA